MLSEQARASGKPEAIIEKMVEGRIRKYYEEVVLLEQVWVHDGESRVRAVVKKAGATLAGFARFQLGEGIEKPTAATSPPRSPPPPAVPSGPATCLVSRGAVSLGCRRVRHALPGWRCYRRQAT